MSAGRFRRVSIRARGLFRPPRTHMAAEERNLLYFGDVLRNDKRYLRQLGERLPMPNSIAGGR